MIHCELAFVLTRLPVPGRVKTRLIHALGDRGAAELHRCLAEHTIRQVDLFRRQRPVRWKILYTGGSRDQVRRWLPGRPLASQGEGDLGTRLGSAFAKGFARGLCRIVAVGTDCPTLSPAILDQAFEALRIHDLVLGPALDGGYYLVGLNRPAPFLFSEIPWGTSRVLEESLRRASLSGYSAALLEPLADVDQPEDLAHLGDHPCSR